MGVVHISWVRKSRSQEQRPQCCPANMWQGQALNPDLSDFRAHEYKHCSIQQGQLSSGTAKCATVAGIVRGFVSCNIYSEGLGRKHSSWDRNNGGCYLDGVIKVKVSTPIFLCGLLVLNSIYFAMQKQLSILSQSKCCPLKDIDSSINIQG